MENIYYSEKQERFYERVSFWDWGFIFKPRLDITLDQKDNYKFLTAINVGKFYPAKNFPFVSHENQLAIASLFRDICDTHKTEICVYLSKPKEEKSNELTPYLFEQSVSAASVQGISTELYNLVTGDLETNTILRLGTVHSHNYFSAFFSGTDDANDLDNPGLHFVIGNLNTIPTQVSSVVVNGVRYKAPLMIDEGILNGVKSIPKKYHPDLIDKLLNYHPNYNFDFEDTDIDIKPDLYYLGYDPEIDKRYDFSFYDYNYGDFVTPRYNYEEDCYVT